MELEIDINGSGTAAEIVASLRSIANDIENGHYKRSLEKDGECEWEDDTLFTYIGEYEEETEL